MGEGQPRIQYIAEHQLEYIQEKSRPRSEPEAFGSGRVRSYESLKKVNERLNILTSKASLSEDEQDEFHVLANQKQRLEAEIKGELFYDRHDIHSAWQKKNTLREKAAIRFFNECLDNFDLKLALRAVLKKEDVTAEDLGECITSEAVPDDLFLRMLECHVRLFERAKENFREEAKIYKADFLISAQKAVDDGFLPIDPILLAQRLNDISVVLIDPLKSDDLGHHSADSWQTQLSVAVPPERRKHAVFHELTHGAISGRSTKLSEYGAGQQKLKMLEHIKFGLRFKVDAVNSLNSSKYTWVNEAITEIIALRLSQEPDLGYYAMERALVDYLTLHSQELGQRHPDAVPLELFLQAYCENFVPNEHEAESLPPTFALLVQKIDQFKGGGKFASMAEQYG